MWGAPRGPPWGWIVSSPDQKPGDLDAILRDAGGLLGLAVQLGLGDRELVRCSSTDIAGLVPLGMGTKPDGAN